MKTSLKLAALLAITLPAAHAQDFDNYRAEPNQWLGLKDKKFHLNSTNDQGNIMRYRRRPEKQPLGKMAKAAP